MYVHPTLVVTPEGVALGVIDAWMWARQPKGQPDVKESTRWVEGYTIVADLAERTPATRFVYVADREGDLRALMDARRDGHMPRSGWFVPSTTARRPAAINSGPGSRKPAPWGRWNPHCRPRPDARRDGCGKRSIAIP